MINSACGPAARTLSRGAVDRWSRPADHPAFRAAAAGAADVRIVDGGSWGRAVRVLQPIVDPAGSRPAHSFAGDDP